MLRGNAVLVSLSSFSFLFRQEGRRGWEGWEIKIKIKRKEKEKRELTPSRNIRV
jgi:hypothetical protein